jgi:uncharacterized protein
MAEETLAAGQFGQWLVELEEALDGKRSADVLCGNCTACCTSSQFVHIAPEEQQTLAHVPRELLFPAPGLPRGHVVLGYDDRGHCPMLVEGRCSIYQVRPRTCRTYDCRVFAAAGIHPDKPAIAERVGQWRFDHLDPQDRLQHEAVRAAARYLRAHRKDLPAGAVPANPTQLAVLAVTLRHLFLSDDCGQDQPRLVEPELEHVESALAPSSAGRAAL